MFMYLFLFFCVGMQAGQQGLYPSLDSIEGGSVLQVQPLEDAQPSMYPQLPQEDSGGAEKEEIAKPGNSKSSQEEDVQVEEPEENGCCQNIDCFSEVGECCCECVKCAGCVGASCVSCIAQTGTRCIAGTRRFGSWVCGLF